MLDIVRTLEQIGLLKEAAGLKLAVEQPDLFDENATQNIPDIIQETDRERIFRENSFANPEDQNSFWKDRESMLRKHLYKLWLDNLKNRSSQELYDEVMAIPVEKLSKEWETAQQKYPHERIEPEDSRQMALPMGQDPEIIVGPSPRQVEEHHRSLSGDVNQLKPLFKELAAHFEQKYPWHDKLIKSCIMSPNSRDLNQKLRDLIYQAKSNQDPEDPLRTLVLKISAIVPDADFLTAPATKINAVFATPIADYTVPKDIYIEGLKKIRAKIDECNKLKAATYDLLSRDGGQIYANPGTIDNLSTVEQIEDWYSRYCLFITENLIRKNAGEKVFGSTRFANRGIGKYDSYFKSSSQQLWFNHPEEFVKWISSSDYKSKPISELGGMSAEVWLTLKLKELEEYKNSLDIVYRALKEDLSWLKRNQEEFRGFSGTKNEILVLNQYIDIVKNHFKDINTFLEQRIRTFNKKEFLAKVFENYTSRLASARGEISRNIFSPVAEEFAEIIRLEYFKWRTGLSSPDEPLTLDKIYFAAERLSEIDKTKDYASAWNYPKFSPWPKEQHATMAESAKRRIGIAAISFFNTIDLELGRKTFDLWQQFSHTAMFEGRGKSEVLASMLKHKEEIFKELDKLFKMHRAFAADDRIGRIGKAMEKIVKKSVELAYPTITSYEGEYANHALASQMMNLYSVRFAIGTDVLPVIRRDEKDSWSNYHKEPFDNILDPKKKEELKKLYVECTYGNFANTFLYHFDGVGPRAINKKISSLKDRQDFKNLNLSDEVLPALSNIAVSYFKNSAAQYVESIKKNDPVRNLSSHFSGDPPLREKNIISHMVSRGDYRGMSALDKMKIKLINHYKTIDEPTIQRLIDLDVGRQEMNYSLEDLNKAFDVVSPETAEKAIDMLPSIVRFAQWIHNDGAGLEKNSLQLVWRNPNRKSLLARDNELILNYFKLFQKLRNIGGYDGIVRKYGNILDVFVRNNNIRRGFKKRTLEFSKLVKNGARLHPDIPGYDDAKSLIIELSADLEVLQNSEVYTKYATEAKKKHKGLSKLNFSLGDEAKWRFRVLNDLDPYHFKVGADTNCCQSLGGAGAAAAVDSFINSLAGVVILEIQTQMGWKTVSQSYFHYVPENNGYILDNVEVNRRNELIFKEAFNMTLDSAYAMLGKKLKEDGAQYFRCGKNYNKLNENNWKSVSLKTGDPRRFAVSKKYTDFSSSSHLDLFQPKFEVSL